MHRLDRLAARHRKYIKQRARGLGLIEQQLRITKPEMVERPAPTYEANLNAPGSPLNLPQVKLRGFDPEFRSEFDNRGRGHAQPIPVPLIKPADPFRPEATMIPWAAQNRLDYGFDDPKVTDFVPKTLLEDLSARNAEREVEMEFGDTNRFNYERDPHIGPDYIGDMNGSGNGLGAVSPVQMARVKQIVQEQEQRRQVAALEVQQRTQEIQQLQQQIQQQQAAVDEGRVVPAVREMSLEKSARPAWFLPAAIGGGLALLGIVILAMKRRK